MNIQIDDNLKLELLNEAHAGELFALTDKNRKYLKKWLPWVDGTQTVKDTLSFITGSKKQFRKNQSLQFAIKYENKLCGMIGLVLIDNMNRKAEIGYWLASKYTGKGIMTKASKSLIKHCFDKLKLNRIFIRCAPGNGRSIGIPERLNFTKEGMLRHDTVLNGRFEDSIIFSLLKDDWKL